MNDETRDIDEEQAAADWEAALTEQADHKAETGEQPARKSGSETQDFSVQRAGLEGLTDDAEAVQDENLNLDVILDIPVTLAMEIGRTRISIRNLLQLNQGSVVELDRLAGEPLDVLVNGTLIAHGEVVVVNERFGIRLTDVISPSERVKKLR